MKILAILILIVTSCAGGLVGFALAKLLGPVVGLLLALPISVVLGIGGGSLAINCVR